ncbi:hypothetical protein WG66_007832 [Moniliophthora roreri]|nr:hypothetical protein WG66_007832 [Moniliophthora roreri]
MRRIVHTTITASRLGPISSQPTLWTLGQFHAESFVLLPRSYSVLAWVDELRKTGMRWMRSFSTAVRVGRKRGEEMRPTRTKS